MTNSQPFTRTGPALLRARAAQLPALVVAQIGGVIRTADDARAMGRVLAKPAAQNTGGGGSLKPYIR